MKELIKIIETQLILSGADKLPEKAYAAEDVVRQAREVYTLFGPVIPYMVKKLTRGLRSDLAAAADKGWPLVRWPLFLAWLWLCITRRKRRVRRVLSLLIWAGDVLHNGKGATA